MKMDGWASSPVRRCAGGSMMTLAHIRPRSADCRMRLRASDRFAGTMPSLMTNISCSGAPLDDVASPPDLSNTAPVNFSSSSMSVDFWENVNLPSI